MYQSKIQFDKEDVFKKQRPILINPTNEEMTISQMIKFFSKYDMCFTKTMIQNYIRIGLLPGPIQKRYYCEDHLRLLFLIYHLKEAFSLEEIKKVFAPILKDETTFEDDLITAKELYDIYAKMEQHLENALTQNIAISNETFILDMHQTVFGCLCENEIIYEFLIVLYTMIQTILSKRMCLYMMGKILP